MIKWLKNVFTKKPKIQYAEVVQRKESDAAHELNLAFIAAGKNDKEAFLSWKAVQSFSGADVKVYCVTGEVEQYLPECQSVGVRVSLDPGLPDQAVDGGNCDMAFILYDQDPTLLIKPGQTIRLKACNEQGMLATCELKINRILTKSWNMNIEDVIPSVYLRLKIQETKPWGKP